MIGPGSDKNGYLNDNMKMYCEEEFPSMEIAIFSQATISSWTIHHQASASRARWICSQVWSHLCKFVKYVNITSVQVVKYVSITSVQVCKYVKYVNFVWSQSVHQINARSPFPTSTMTDTYTIHQEARACYIWRTVLSKRAKEKLNHINLLRVSSNW